LTKENPIATIDHRIIMSDGTIRWQRWSDRAIFDNLGTLIEYQSVGRDITDVKRAEEALKEAHEKLNLLSSITRHDILNKITACTGYLTLAKQKPTGSELEHLLNGLQKNIEEIQCQIEFTRLYEDLGIRSPIWQNVDEILSQYLSFEIPVSTSLNGIEIYADPMLPKMFANLMDNTLRHGQRATHVRVGSSLSQDGLILIWEDNGTGIPDKEKEIIFERGYGKHSGLGLFFVREMLSITGISIHETGNYGTGARFEISVPKGKFRCMDKTM
jgi:signal transduction histidine kinase